MSAPRVAPDSNQGARGCKLFTFTPRGNWLKSNVKGEIRPADKRTGGSVR